MERENRTDRSRPDGRGRPLRRLLVGFRAHFRKARDPDGRPPTWWNEPVAVPACPSANVEAGRGRQGELWEESATTAVLVERERPADEGPTPVSLHVGAVQKRHTVLNAGLPEKGRTMSPLAIARFLRIGGSVYDGRDEGRWFALPGRKNTAPFQVLRPLAVSADDRRDGMASERIGSRRSDGL